MTKWKKPHSEPKANPQQPAGWASVLPGEYLQRVRLEEQRKKNREYMKLYRAGVRKRDK